MVVHSRLVCHEVVMDHEWNRKRATGHQSLNLDNAKLTMEPELQNISFYHHLGGRIGFNTMAVLHQNSGVIGKSTPSALEISLNLMEHGYSVKILEAWIKHCQKHNGPMGWHHNWRYLIACKFGHQVGGGTPHSLSYCLGFHYWHHQLVLTSYLHQSKSH